MDVVGVSKYLLKNCINLTSNNKWLIDCINWFNSNPNLRGTYGSLQEYCIIQWLISDLKDVRNSCLPNVADGGATVLSGNYAVQINWIRDIGQSCYSQYRSIKHKDATLNDEVTAEETKKQSWEPNPKRVLMMEITDGVNIMRAMEYGSIPKLGVGFLPGMKILLKGPIECRRKILFLKNCNVDIFGGEVEELYEINSTENVLSRCLNLPDLRPNVTSVQDGTAASAQNSGITNGLTHSSLPSSSNRSSFQTNTSTINRSQVSGPVITDTHLETLPEENFMSPTYSNNEYCRSNVIEDMDALEDDDDFLNQLPDEMLDNDCANTFDNGSRKQSPQFLGGDDSNNVPSPQPGPSIPFQVPPRINSQRSLKINKPKRFPSLDVFSSEGKSDSSLSKTTKIQSTLTNFVSQNTPVVSSTSTRIISSSSKYFSPVASPSHLSPVVTISDSSGLSQHNSLNSPVVPFIPNSSSTCVKNIEERSRQVVKGHTQICSNNQTTVEKSCPNSIKSRNVLDYKQANISSLDECIMEIKDIRRQKCKVINVSKLKVKDQKWTCEVNLNIDGQSKQAHLSDMVAVQIFGIEAAKMESLKKEILTNPRTKQEMNRILQAGGAKIKSLDCLMTLEYSADDSIPVITSINDNR